MNKPKYFVLAALIINTSFLASISFAQQNDNQSKDFLKQAVFAQHCFWTGEMVYGGIEGVKYTEAGFYDGREVTRVWYNPQQVSLSELKKSGQSAGVADRLYAKEKPSESENVTIDALFNERSYRRAPERDQKKQLQGTALQNTAMTEYQRTKANAFVRKDFGRAKSYLDK